MRRREFIAGLGSAAACPLAAAAQQDSRIARVAFFVLRDLDDPMEQVRLSWFKQGLQALNWHEGRNLRLEVRGAAENVERMGALAKEIVDLRPDVIVVQGGRPTLAVQQQTQSLPIVFVQAGDAIANGLVKSIARPEGNTTGISNNLPGFVAHRKSADVSDPTGALGRRISSGRRHRHHCAPDRSMALGAAWSAIHHREPAGRRQQRCRRSRRAFAPGRLHASSCFFSKRDQYNAL
jgi:hypothetical protein